MTWLSLIASLCRIVGLIDWADKLYQMHEAKVKAQEAANARNDVDALSDAELDKRVRDDITRK